MLKEKLEAEKLARKLRQREILKQQKDAVIFNGCCSWNLF